MSTQNVSGLVCMNHSIDEMQGILYMVATPIGNLEDITLRALRILKEVDLIAAEDTRHTRILLKAYEIQTPLISLHEHNEKERSALIVSKIETGLNVAYVSDAGTPCISDPGYRLVAYASERKIRVVPVPGPSALVAALSVSGVPADSFFFCGFLPAKESARRRFLEGIKNLECTLIFYESPMRIIHTLKDLHQILGNRQMVAARELTKVFEEVRRGPVSELMSDVSGVKSKGEYTVIVYGAENTIPEWSDEEIQNKLVQLWSDNKLSVRDAVAFLAAESGLPKKRIYDVAVKFRSESRQNEDEIA